ncbi:MAG TPA: type II secretion system protein [Candidatus Paceibacterota bacterium]
MKIRNSYIKKAGFTLVESMVAISILSMAVTGPLLIAQKGIGSAIYARDQITAFYLAQEAVEYIRNVRDTNRIQNIWWLRQFCGESPCTTVNGTYKIDTTYANFNDDSSGAPKPGAISLCSGTCPTLSFDTDRKLYGYSGGVGTWVPTIFTRTITINNSAMADQAEISVSISWNTNLFSPVRTFTVKEYLFNF